MNISGLLLDANKIIWKSTEWNPKKEYFAQILNA